jgi:hypothetical protein
MQEDFLHYVWKYQKIEGSSLKTTQYEDLEIIQVGQHNDNSGPDFFNAQLKIGSQLWAGNVEIHVKSSDWFVHNHELDSAYDNVILHVVYEHDTDIFRKDNTAIPTLELKHIIKQEVMFNYEKLFSKKKKWINCENDLHLINDFTYQNWIERLFIERLERKSELINDLLQKSKHDWEAVLFQLLAKNFGLNINGDAFFSMAQSIDFSVVRKSQSKLELLEALFFGQSGLLENEIENAYHIQLKNDFKFLSQKFALKQSLSLPMHFFRLRPSNFPTIRISQFAALYHKELNLFSKTIEVNSLKDYYKLFKVCASDFWNSHYTFEKTSKTTTKCLTKPFIDLILINTILPIKFLYEKQRGNEHINENILKLASSITSESNSIVNAFNELKKVSHSALTSQALLQLKSNYCDKNKCLQCAIGNALFIK